MPRVLVMAEMEKRGERIEGLARIGEVGFQGVDCGMR